MQLMASNIVLAVILLDTALYAININIFLDFAKLYSYFTYTLKSNHILGHNSDTGERWPISHKSNFHWSSY